MGDRAGHLHVVQHGVCMVEEQFPGGGVQAFVISCALEEGDGVAQLLYVLPHLHCIASSEGWVGEEVCRKTHMNLGGVNRRLSATCFLYCAL